MEDALVATDGNWLKLTVHAMQDFTSSLRSKQMDFYIDNSAKSIGCQYWNFAVTLLDFYNGGNVSSAAAPGEIPGEMC